MSDRKPYRLNSGQPPWTHSLGTGDWQQEDRPKRLFAWSHWGTTRPRYSITIWPLAAQHHMLVSWYLRLTDKLFCPAGGCCAWTGGVPRRNRAKAAHRGHNP